MGWCQEPPPAATRPGQPGHLVFSEMTSLLLQKEDLRRQTMSNMNIFQHLSTGQYSVDLIGTGQFNLHLRPVPRARRQTPPADDGWCTWKIRTSKESGTSPSARRKPLESHWNPKLFVLLLFSIFFLDFLLALGCFRFVMVFNLSYQNDQTPEAGEGSPWATLWLQSRQDMARLLCWIKFHKSIDRMARPLPPLRKLRGPEMANHGQR